jgi:hypothetical protein
MLFVIANELIMLSIIACSNIGEDRGLGLIKDFSSAMIICEMDDIVMALGRIQNYKEKYNN